MLFILLYYIYFIFIYNKMNLKAELQKMNVSDLKYICKDLGVSCPKTKSSIVKKLLEPLKISYKMNKRKRVKVKRKMKCSEINELYKNPIDKNPIDKNPIDKTRKIRDECEKRDDCTWTIDPSHRYYKCMSKNYIHIVRPRIQKIINKYEKYNKKPKLNKFNQLIEKAHEEDVKSGDYYKRELNKMRISQQKYKDIPLFELFEKIDMNENPQGPKSIYDRYEIFSKKNQKHYKVKEYKRRRKRKYYS